MLVSIWLTNSGHYTGLLLGLGLFSVAFVVWVSHRMDVVDHESQPVHLTARLPGYYLWLGKRIMMSNIDVVVRIWRGNATISPCLEKLPATQKTDMGQVIYANSINLTPGTLSVELEDDCVLVHSLTQDGMSELQKGDMHNRVCELEK